MKKILMIAFHYPPVHGSSGIHRTLNFSRYLSDYGWQPIMLTVTPGAYPRVRQEQVARIPPDVLVGRAPALDTARHLSIRGFYPRWLSLPDRWVTWWPTGVLKGLALIRRHRPDLLWSTYPIATAHLIGLTLHRLSGLPWVADFRDPMTEVDPVTGEEYPEDPTVRRVNGWVERPTVRHCAKAVLTTPGTKLMYATRYRKTEDSHWAIIANGFDEESFCQAQSKHGGKHSRDGQIVLVHSGTLYPSARDPRAFFAAVADLRHRKEISSSNLRIVLRDTGFDAIYRSYLKQLNIDDIVSLEDNLSYEEALAEMLDADGLLIFQARNCNWQIPAKVYEYLRAQRPILALTDRDGDTGNLLMAEGIDTIVPIDASDQIAQGLLEFLTKIRNNTAPVATRSGIERHSRRSRTQELAALLDSVLASSTHR